MDGEEEDFSSSYLLICVFGSKTDLKANTIEIFVRKFNENVNISNFAV